MAVVNTIMNHDVPKNEGNFLTSQTACNFTGRSLLHGIAYGAGLILDLDLRHIVGRGRWRLET